MPKVTYVHPNGAREVLDVPLGTSVMRAAIVNSVDGIVAECGGEMMCATCHVYVEPEQLNRMTRRRCSNSRRVSASRTAV
jgi:ferredoxin, 2Fe-2S